MAEPAPPPPGDFQAILELEQVGDDRDRTCLDVQDEWDEGGALFTVFYSAQKRQPRCFLLQWPQMSAQ